MTTSPARLFALLLFVVAACGPEATGPAGPTDPRSELAPAARGSYGFCQIYTGGWAFFGPMPKGHWTGVLEEPLGSTPMDVQFRGCTYPGGRMAKVSYAPAPSPNPCLKTEFFLTEARWGAWDIEERGVAGGCVSPIGFEMTLEDGGWTIVGRITTIFGDPASNFPPFDEIYFTLHPAK